MYYFTHSLVDYVLFFSYNVELYIHRRKTSGQCVCNLRDINKNRYIKIKNSYIKNSNVVERINEKSFNPTWSS